jgi:hypothetical protein
VSILPAPPVLITLKAPAHISPRARTLTLHLAAVAPATLTVGRAHALITRKLTAVHIHVKPGRKTLMLTLILHSGTFSTRVPVTLPR